MTRQLNLDRNTKPQNQSHTTPLSNKTFRKNQKKPSTSTPNLKSYHPVTKHSLQKPTMVDTNDVKAMKLQVKKKRRKETEKNKNKCEEEEKHHFLLANPGSQDF